MSRPRLKGDAHYFRLIIADDKRFWQAAKRMHLKCSELTGKIIAEWLAHGGDQE